MGFGDIVATSHSAQVLVTVQMILDLILIGAVIRAFVEAAKEGPRDTTHSIPRCLTTGAGHRHERVAANSHAR